ncbi:MAG: hypothetical protein V1907_04685 [Candidatus Kerfeldbacteria bacterium]
MNGHQSLKDLSTELGRLADHVLTEEKSLLGGYLEHMLTFIISRLVLLTPGLEVDPDSLIIAEDRITDAEREFIRGNPVKALSHALRGLERSPHHPVLWFHVGSACAALDIVHCAMRAFVHASWIHPGYEEPKRAFGALMACYYGDP